MPVPLMHITGESGLTALVVTRDEAVPDVFWLRLRSEWGADGSDPRSAVRVPVERFVSRLAWLAPACRRHRVGIQWDDASRGLVLHQQDERRLLEEARTTDIHLSEDEIAARLAGTRFHRTLREFQVRDVGRILVLPHGANFSVPGAGKTTVAYAAYEAERRAGRVEQLLVVAPLSAFEAWVDEAGECMEPPPVIERYIGAGISSDTEVLLLNYHRVCSGYEVIAGWASRRPTHIILDEAHRMKRGWSGLWGRTCLNLAHHATRRDILTGTPAPQSFRDLEALMDYVWPAQARRILPAAAMQATPPVGAGHLVAEAIRPLFVRTTKSELGLRAPTHSVVRVPLEGLQKEIYDALLNQYAGRFALARRDRVGLARMGAVVMYMLEAATNPALLASGSSRYDPVEFEHPPLPIADGSSLSSLLADYARYETPRKLVELASMVRDNAEAGRKTLIWTSFVRNLVTLERMLARYEPAMIHGSVPSEATSPRAERTRESELVRFREPGGRCMVLLANPAAMSEGISLHRDCHDAIYLDRTFNAGQFIQSVDRIHRLGMDPDQETRITLLVTSDTMDEVVEGRIQEKTVRLAEALDDRDLVAMALPDEESFGTVIDSEDLVALFAHLRSREERG